MRHNQCMAMSDYTPIYPSGKAIQHFPTEEDLAQDFCASHGWVNRTGYNAIFTDGGREWIADNLADLARRMRNAGAFFHTPSGALQITHEFNSLSTGDLIEHLS